MHTRPRRNRKSEGIRKLVEETKVHLDDLIFPLFLLEGENDRVEVESMPGIYRLGLQSLLKEVETCLKLGIRAFDIFPVVPEHFKNPKADKSFDDGFFYQKALREIKKQFPEAVIMTDVALDPYNSDGHDGLVKGGEILNDETLEVLGKQALSQAACGIDIIGPSDMMDGRVGYIRSVLDENGFQDVSIMSYTAKYASGFYGPFRDALDSAPRGGDKKTYQMNPANQQEALLEAELDVNEGADFLMVKPALAYLDIIHILKESFVQPIAAYNVSGEFAMLKAAAEKGWLNYQQVMPETLLSIKRAGADIILTYHAKEFALLKG